MSELQLPRVLYDDDYPAITWLGVTAAEASAIAELAASFLATSATEPDLSFERPRVPLDDGGPFACPPGRNGDGWVIAFEGAYNWTIAFAPLIFEDGPLGEYCRAHELFIEIETGLSISLQRDQSSSE
jgi:hypothetical protein